MGYHQRDIDRVRSYEFYFDTKSGGPAGAEQGSATIKLSRGDASKLLKAVDGDTDRAVEILDFLEENQGHLSTLSCTERSPVTLGHDASFSSKMRMFFANFHSIVDYVSENPGTDNDALYSDFVYAAIGQIGSPDF